MLVIFVFFGLMYLIFVGVLIIAETQNREFEEEGEKKSLVFIIVKSFLFPIWVIWSVIKESLEKIG